MYMCEIDLSSPLSYTRSGTSSALSTVMSGMRDVEYLVAGLEHPWGRSSIRLPWSTSRDLKLPTRSRIFIADVSLVIHDAHLQLENCPCSCDQVLPRCPQKRCKPLLHPTPAHLVMASSSSSSSS